MPTVSFLMSNYQTPPAFLRRALDSMLAQTLADFQAVIVNDGVKDASWEVLLEYAAKDPRIRLIENEKNLGLPKSLNRAMDACTGKYVARMDTDDICFPDRLARQVDYMESHPDVMFAGAWADQFETDENVVTARFDPVMCPQEEYRIRLLFANRPLLVHPTVIFRREFLQKNGLRYSEDPAYRYTEDYEFWTRCADCGTAGILEEPVILYRQAPLESRITVRHKEESAVCSENVQKKLLSKLEIAPSEYDPAVHMCLLNGRKPYDIRYKKWMARLCRQNRKYKIYDQITMRRVFRDRWFSIVYYGIAYEKDPFKRLRYVCTLPPGDAVRFAKTLLKKGDGKP
ncbi:MAG: glycosyltransferase [Clostridia bacterium]|nr:glycosyltransferase [Clostridia bacterium]